MFIQTERTPNPETLKFIPGRVVMKEGTAFFQSINVNRNSKLKIIHITNFNFRYFGRLQYNTGIRINNGLIRQGHNILSLSDRDLISFSKTFRDPSGSKYLNKLIGNSIDNFKPDLIIMGHADKVDPNLLHDTKNKYKQKAARHNP